MEYTDEIEKFIDEGKKRKSRRSSISKDSVKFINQELMNLSDSQSQNMVQILNTVVDIQYKWIHKKINDLEYRLQKSRKRAEKSSLDLGLAQKGIHFNEENRKQKDHYELLDQKQQEFLNSTEITDELITKHLERLRKHSIKKVLEKMNTTSFKTSGHSFLTNNYSRMSFSASCHEQNKTKSCSKDLAQILNEYFDS